jgi:hypothetical protein
VGSVMSDVDRELAAGYVDGASDQDRVIDFIVL